MPPDSDLTSEKTKALIQAIWTKGLPILRARLDLLDRAAAAANSGTLPEPLRQEALSAAHNLAGTLGMFGYPEGTTLARQCEVALDRTTPESKTLATLARGLRAALPLGPEAAQPIPGD